MGIIWGVLGIFAALLVMAGLVDRTHRRDRGIPIDPSLAGRARRDAVRASRAQFVHGQMASGGGYLGYTGGADGGGFAGGHGGGHGGMDGGGCADGGGGC